MLLYALLAAAQIAAPAKLNFNGPTYGATLGSPDGTLVEGNRRRTVWGEVKLQAQDRVRGPEMTYGDRGQLHARLLTGRETLTVDLRETGFPPLPDARVPHPKAGVGGGVVLGANGEPIVLQGVAEVRRNGKLVTRNARVLARVDVSQLPGMRIVVDELPAGDFAGGRLEAQFDNVIVEPGSVQDTFASARRAWRGIGGAGLAGTSGPAADGGTRGAPDAGVRPAAPRAGAADAGTGPATGGAGGAGAPAGAPAPAPSQVGQPAAAAEEPAEATPATPAAPAAEETTGAEAALEGAAPAGIGGSGAVENAPVGSEMAGAGEGAQAVGAQPTGGTAAIGFGVSLSPQVPITAPQSALTGAFPGAVPGPQGIPIGFGNGILPPAAAQANAQAGQAAAFPTTGAGTPLGANNAAGFAPAAQAPAVATGAGSALQAAQRSTTRLPLPPNAVTTGQQTLAAPGAVTGAPTATGGAPAVTGFGNFQTGPIQFASPVGSVGVPRAAAASPGSPSDLGIVNGSQMSAGIPASPPVLNNGRFPAAMLNGSGFVTGIPATPPVLNDGRFPFGLTGFAPGVTGVPTSPGTTGARTGATGTGAATGAGTGR